jgi:hypothetical protein
LASFLALPDKNATTAAPGVHASRLTSFVDGLAGFGFGKRDFLLEQTDRSRVTSPSGFSNAVGSGPGFRYLAVLAPRVGHRRASRSIGGALYDSLLDGAIFG